MSTIVSPTDRLRRAIERPLGADWPSELHRDLLAYIEQLELQMRVTNNVLRMVRAISAEQLNLAGRHAAALDLIMRNWPCDMSNGGR